MPKPATCCRASMPCSRCRCCARTRSIGGLVIRRRTAGGFAATILTLMQTFAGQSVLAIENARLFQELPRVARRHAGLASPPRPR